jgi:CRISP-associated protein Cas1
MLNYGYGILYQRIWSAAVMASLNPNISFLHALQKKKPTLIYDLIEEFRQTLVDRPIFSMMTKGRRYEKFKIDPRTGLLDKKTKEITLSAVLSRLSSLIGYRGKKVRAEDIIYFQAENMAKYIAGTSSVYKPFISTY